jgi:hypothetical protein
MISVLKISALSIDLTLEDVGVCFYKCVCLGFEKIETSLFFSVPYTILKVFLFNEVPFCINSVLFSLNVVLFLMLIVGICLQSR